MGQQPRDVKTVWRVIQVTDVHLYAKRWQTLLGLNTYQTFQAVLQELQIHHWPADAVLATGDLTQDGSISAYQLLREALTPLQTPVYFIPGNHDQPQVMDQILPGGLISKQRQVLLGPWQIILLDSTVPDQVGGYLDRTQLDYLTSCLAQYPDYYALVCLHHHPVNIDCDWMADIGLANGTEFMDLISQYPQVRGVLWGHIHQEFQQYYQGMLLMASPSTCVQFKPQTNQFSLDTELPGYRWLDLTADGTIQTGIRRLTSLGQGLTINMAAKGY